ncbi:unnamed protein product (macronuclear) [Paramecium tetraurelia]|uniref:Uncharacterized protein n=1 Tax=Paramecium tetraurelia TaxID=5888 RepID=A0CPT3_PARTE|nr:uncharacterized protein GSPATT00009192001 [Paramecium tetraurelia]CAK72800.1 unnamed protein product [Paramecium tetraurelia]|eukprot:XP_001440197.1 hypothetical protein (macronuclear) [Paramecium tetraurelia strain d4-2]
MNSSKTSRTTKAINQLHIEQKISFKNHFNISTLRESVPTILKANPFSPSIQSFPVQKQPKQNGYRKLSIEKKITLLKKEIMNSQSGKSKQLFQTQKLQIKEGFYVIDVKSDIKSIRSNENRSDKKFKLFQSPIAIQDKLSKYSNLQEKQTFLFKFREKHPLVIDEVSNHTPKYQAQSKQPSEPNSPFFIRKLQSQQIIQRSISQGVIEKPKQNKWIAWPQNLEGWNTHMNNPEEDIMSQLHYF